MKRQGHLMEQMATFPNLYQAWCKARKGSRNSAACQAFAFHLESNLLLLKEALWSGTYRPAPYRHFVVQDPKRRLISVADFKDRVVHHAIVGMLEPIYELSFIFDSYATRKGKGTHAAIKRAQQFLRRSRFFLKADVDQYFASVNLAILMNLLARKVKDKQFLNLIELVLANGGHEGKGLPIGNLTSQFFANVYLNPLDHFIKQTLGFSEYIRYMDDFVLFSENRKTLLSAHHQVQSWLDRNLFLSLKNRGTYQGCRSQGLSFLGTIILPDRIRMNGENLRRMQQKIIQKENAWHAGKMDESQFLQSQNSHWAHLAQFDTLGLRKMMVNKDMGADR